MKNIKRMLMSGAILLSTGIMNTSCSDWLDLAPIDYYGSGSYWQNEAQVLGYIDGIHKHLRDASWQHTIVFGELRGGHYRDGVGADGMTLAYGDIRLQNFDEDHTGVSKFGDLYGRITNLNLFIARTADASFLSEDKKNYCLGIVYGLRAFYYFELYRIYGGVPLRLGVEVIDGELDPNKLYLGRSTPKQVMDQIKSDLKESMDHFGDQNGFNVLGKGDKVYWSKAATECLAAEVSLWNAKVSIGDNKSDLNELAVAKTHLQNVMNNYNLSMQKDFDRVFDAKNKANSEIVFAVRFAEGEATNANAQYCYNLGTGATNTNFREDGTPWNDPLGCKQGAQQQYEYNTDLFRSFDLKDSRRNATFIASYVKDKDGKLVINGTHVRKNIGYINEQGNRIYCGDFIYYRLPWIYLSLAEIANMEGNNSEVEKYINLVRERAYAENWDKEKMGYNASDFTSNELAILHEKDKEFVQEGQRWWDLCRMTLTKGGKHLVFCKEGSLDGKLPILDEKTESYKVLWPLDKGILSNDPALEQTPGYGKK